MSFLYTFISNGQKEKKDLPSSNLRHVADRVVSKCFVYQLATERDCSRKQLDDVAGCSCPPSCAYTQRL